MSIVLSPQELEAYTLKSTPGRQRRVLKHINVPFRVRPDGTLIVLVSHVHEAYDESHQVQRVPRLRFA
jgi:Domain of unknown function (DUF4224)